MKPTRRSFLQTIAAAGAAGALGRSPWASGAPGEGGAAPASPPRTGMGICVYALGNRIRAKRPGDPPLDRPIAFLEHCAAMGAGGIQVPLRLKDADEADRLRRRAEELGMFVEGIVQLPENDADAAKLDAELELAARAGASVARTVLIAGRRYENYRTAAEFEQAVRKGTEALERAAGIAARRKVRLALENHKCHRAGERIELLKRVGSEHVGVCLDLANNFALLEDPLDVVKALAPWTLSVHIKDFLVQETPDGFLVTDTALGDGILDLPALVKILREARPEARYCLESITREPISVPCLDEGYWKTFGPVPASDLARTLRVVRDRSMKTLPPADVPEAEQLRREDETVRRSISYAVESLRL